MQNLVLFGAGVYAKKFKALLEYLNMDFGYFTDNDSQKWGTILYGKEVIAPEELKKMENCKIIISCVHENAIRKQLAEMDLADNIVGLDDLYRMCEEKKSKTGKHIINKSDQHTVIVDMYEGIGWGGTELWAANLAYGMGQQGIHVMLLGGTQQPSLDSAYERLTVRVSEQQTITQMVKLMEKNLPCTVINNFAGCAYLAAIIIKKKYPELIKIISVIHSDNKSLFDAHMMLSSYIDRVFCVSNQIKEHMIPLYDMEKEHYFFKEQPMQIDNQWKKISNYQKVLRIGYAARLVKQQKRADLLTFLINELENRKMNYQFEIAGEGECYEELNMFIHEHDLRNRVRLLGRIPKSQMEVFWKRQDIFVNVSESEGSSLAMLEAMSYGCVPVVTDVSGVREFIVNRQNGYICDIGDFSKMADAICELDYNRSYLETFGQRCRKIISERCNPEKYIEYWIDKVL